MAPYQPSEVVTILYFKCYRVDECDIAKLIHLKCQKERTETGVHSKFKDLFNQNDLRQGLTNQLDPKKVGRYIRSIMGDAVEFNEIIRWGTKEIELCTVSCWKDQVLRIKLRFDGQSSKYEADSVSLGKLALGQMNDVQAAYLFPDHEQ